MDRQTTRVQVYGKESPMEEKKVKTPQELDPEQVTDVNGGTDPGGLTSNVGSIYRCMSCQKLLYGQAALIEHWQRYHQNVNPES